MLFRDTQALKNSKTPEKSKSFGKTIKDQKIRVLVTRGYEDLEKSVGRLEQGETVISLTNGAWSAIDLTAYLVGLMGEVDRLFITTWAINDQAVKVLRELLEIGAVKRLTMILDVMTKNTHFEAVSALESFAEVCFRPNHSKNIVLINEQKELYYTSIGSGNFQRNNRLESYTIVSDKQATLDFERQLRNAFEFGHLLDTIENEFD